MVTLNKEGFFQRFFSLGDLLKDRIQKKGHERETGDIVQALVQIGAFGKSPWSYFGQVRQTMVEKKSNQKLMSDARIFMGKFHAATRDRKDIRDKALEYTKALDYAIANGWNDHTEAAMKQCRTLLEEHNIELPEAAQDIEMPKREISNPLFLKMDGEDVELDTLYHYELVRPNSRVPRTFTLPYSLFKHSPQRRYTETNEGAKTKYKLYSFFMLVFTLAFNIMSFVFIGSNFHPGGAAYNYLIIPLAVSMFWLLVMWFIVKMVIGTTWVQTPYLVPFGESREGDGPQPMLLVNSQSIDFVKSVSAFLHISPENIDAMGETMKSFQEATFSRLKLDNKAKDIKISALEDNARKARIQDDTQELNGVRTRTVTRMPKWVLPAVVFLMVVAGIESALLAMIVASAG